MGPSVFLPMPMSAPLDIPTLLARVPLFQGLSPEELAPIARGTREMSAAKGHILFHKGDPCNGMHLVVYGQVKLAITSPQGGEKVVEVLSQGQTFGEALMFAEKPYIVYGQTLADSQLLFIAKEALFAELDREPRLGRKMMAGLSRRLHQMVTDVAAYTLQSGRQRVIGFLLRDLPEQQAGGPVTLHLSTSKGVLASRLNLTQEHFSRILHELAEAGLIRVEGRHIHIPDGEALRRYDL